MRVRSFFFVLLACLILFPPVSLTQTPQITIRPTAQEEIILAAPDVQPLYSEQAEALAPILRTFNEVLWDDLKFSGFFTMAGKGFYPTQPIVTPEDLDYDAWSTLPFRISFLTAGTLELDGGVLRAELRIFDMKQRAMGFGLKISGDTDQVRSIAHRWADEIVTNLTAGASHGIARTKIAYTSRRGGSKEIYVMDYDGYDARAFTRNNSLNLFPTWSPDNSILAFVSFRTGKWEINIHSYLDGSRLPFPMFNTTTSTPVISPDGSRLAFMMSDKRGNIDIYTSRLDGSDQRNVTNSSAIDSSPTWSPSGNQIAFSSNRSGIPQIYVCDSDGAHVRRIVKEGGDADSPAWSPDGRWIAFHWKPRMAINYDIFVAEAVSERIFQLTSDSGSNESPTWSPDGRHLAFQSNRTGSNQIFIMLVDTRNPELRMVTSQGDNTSPAWGGYARQN